MGLHEFLLHVGGAFIQQKNKVKKDLKRGGNGGRKESGGVTGQRGGNKGETEMKVS